MYENYQKERIDIIKKVLQALNDNFVLKGGTALSLYYGLNRYSEDIDLDAKSNNMDITKLLKSNKNFRDYNITIKKDTDTVFRTMLDYGGQSHLGNYPLKIEVSNRNKIFLQQGSLTYTNIDGVNVYNISELIDMKIAAFNGRDKVRDLYDLNFLLNKYPEYFDHRQLWQINERIAYCGTDELNILLADEVKKHKLISNENIDLNNFVQNFQARIENTLNDKRIEKQKEFIKNLSIKDKQIQNREPQRER